MAPQYAKPTAQPSPHWFPKRLREIAMFFEGADAVHVTMRRLAELLDRAGIPYAIMGGMAVNAHRYERTTRDVDILLTPDGLVKFADEFLNREFDPVSGRPRRFRDRQTGVTVDVLVAGLFPGSGRPGPIAFPHPVEVSERIGEQNVISLGTLIQLKLAARRHQDFADVVNLIRVHDLTESYADQLHPAVRGDFIECLEEKRREDEYEKRQDRALEELRNGASPPDDGSP